MNDTTIIIISATTSVFTAIFVKEFTKNETKKYYLYLAMALSIVTTLLYVILFRKHDASYIYNLVKILSVIMITIVGYLLLGENMSLHKVLGLLFGLIAIYLLSRK